MGWRDPNPVSLDSFLTLSTRLSPRRRSAVRPRGQLTVAAAMAADVKTQSFCSASDTLIDIVPIPAAAAYDTIAADVLTQYIGSHAPTLSSTTEGSLVLSRSQVVFGLVVRH